MMKTDYLLSSMKIHKFILKKILKFEWSIRQISYIHTMQSDFRFKQKQIGLGHSHFYCANLVQVFFTKYICNVCSHWTSTHISLLRKLFSIKRRQRGKTVVVKDGPEIKTQTLSDFPRKAVLCAKKLHTLVADWVSGWGFIEELLKTDDRKTD